MKKYFNFALLSAIALTGTIGFTSCSSTEEPLAAGEEIQSVDDNPTYDPVKGTVTSQFVLNIASDTKSNGRRSGATTVQAGGNNFRGIDNTLLFAFKTSGQGFVDATFADADAASRYDLGTVATANSLDNSGSDSHRILELAMPTGTDAMLFYGKAIRGTTPDLNEIGKVTYTLPAKKATAFSFALCPRVIDVAGANRFQYTGELLAAIMTKIINVTGSYTVNTTTYSGWTGAATLTSTWKDLNPTTQGRALSPLEEILYKAFTTLTSYGTNELRGGSSKAVLTTVRDLYSVTTKVVGATATSPYEELAISIAEAINTQITTYFTTTSTPIDGIKKVSGIKSSLTSASSWNSNWDVVTDAELADFPVVNFTLPEGAAQLEFNETDTKFTHKTPGTSLLNKATTTDPIAYQFPAELMYYCNSGVRTSNTEKTDAKFPNGVGNWDTDSKWTELGWEGGTSVTSATRATAMTKNVNYGVAMLKSYVSIKEGVTALEDNRAALNTGESNQSFNPAEINFSWTGVIVGGQPGSVDWQFLPAAGFDKLVYDNRVAGDEDGTSVPKAAGTPSDANYTILFDNYASGATQSKVRVALQFVNNGDDFWGRDNLIRKGQTFYLVAELDPAKEGLTAPTWDTYYQIPPLDANGVSTKTSRVFIQDYMTTANFKLTADATNHTSSLQDAYITIPDLRSSQLSFGLSVDLNWRQGLEFDVDLGGN